MSPRIPTRPTSPDQLTHVDVVIVGAGLAGLTAARALAASGASIRVFEANNRVGGRVLSESVDGVHVDLGGTFVGPGQDRIIALADEMGVARYPTHEHGKNLIRWRGRRRPYEGTIPPLGPAALLDLARIRSLLERLAASIPGDRPELAPRAEWMDSHSLGSWMQSRRATASTRKILAIVAKTTWGCEPAEISLLHAAHYIGMSGGLDSMLDTRGGAQEEHFVEGSHEIASRMANALGEQLVLGQAVTRIDWDSAGALAHTRDTVTRARWVIIAVPPAMRQKIQFSPTLGPDHNSFVQRWPLGVLSKAYAVYDTPFWRTAGFSGQALSDEGPVFITFDASPPDDSAGVLLGFIGGDYARTWDALDKPARRNKALGAFAALFGPAALGARAYTDQRWATEDWVGGGPSAAPGPGGVLPYTRQVATPIGPIHWAGTETSSEWNGFMDGAVRSGERAAREVLQELRITSISQEGAPV
jgi:monoamine oxidase